MIKKEYAIIDGTRNEAEKKEEEDKSTVVDKEQNNLINFFFFNFNKLMKTWLKKKLENLNF